MKKLVAMLTMASMLISGSAFAAGVEPTDTDSAIAVGENGKQIVTLANEKSISSYEPASVDSPKADVDSVPADPRLRSTLYWYDTEIDYDTRMRFTRGYEDNGYFVIEKGVTATFTVEITDGDMENIEIDWCDSEGRVTELYDGKTSEKTVTYTPRAREKGNFRVWNKSAAAIEVDATLTY